MTAENNNAMIRATGLEKRFGLNTVLQNVSLDVHRGEVVAIIGPSGSGKSTLLRCLNLLEVPDAGELNVGEHHFSFQSDRRRTTRVPIRKAARLRRDMGMVFQHFNLYPHMTVLGNIIEGPIQVRRTPRAQAIESAHALLAKVGLAEKADQYPNRLSGGQRQRVAIARALAMEPKAMLFDEATSALDPELVGEVLQVIKNLARDGMTMILVTHEMAFAREIADRVCFMDSGTISVNGHPSEVLDSPPNARLASFLERFTRR